MIEEQFDFITFLQAQQIGNADGNPFWEVQELKGGVANHTARVRRLSGVGPSSAQRTHRPQGHHRLSTSAAGDRPVRRAILSHEQEERRPELPNGKAPAVDYRAILEKHESVVMKQAPFHLAKAPQFGFSPYRQVVEYSALKLFHPAEGLSGLHRPRTGRLAIELDPNSSSFSPQDQDLYAGILERHPYIRVPKPLAHDIYHNVLVQSDLGPLPSLYDVLVSPHTTPAEAGRVGRVLGAFLADMHIVSYRAIVGGSGPGPASVNGNASGHSAGGRAGCSPVHDVLNTFTNPDAERLLQTLIGNVVVGFMEEAGVSDARVLGERALQHWEARERTVFAQGDLWFGTVLVGGVGGGRSRLDDAGAQDGEEEGQEDRKEEIEVGLCDWEFAGPSCFPADIAQLGCYLHLLSLSSRSTAHTVHLTETLAEGMYASYLEGLVTGPGGSNAACRLDDLEPGFSRSLLIMHGWEMVNAAGWDARQDMWCDCNRHRASSGSVNGHSNSSSGNGVEFREANQTVNNTIGCDHLKAMVIEGAALIRNAGDGHGRGVDWGGESSWAKFLGLFREGG